LISPVLVATVVIRLLSPAAVLEGGRPRRRSQPSAGLLRQSGENGGEPFQKEARFFAGPAVGGEDQSQPPNVDVHRRPLPASADGHPVAGFAEAEGGGVERPGVEEAGYVGEGRGQIVDQGRGFLVLRDGGGFKPRESLGQRPHAYLAMA